MRKANEVANAGRNCAVHAQNTLVGKNRLMTFPSHRAINCASIPTLLLLLLVGCKSSPPAAPAGSSPAPAPAAAYPARPTTAPAAFKIFHHGNSSFTLTVNDKATDDQLAALVWQLRDAARNHTFDSIHIQQKEVDADGMTVWFHIECDGDVTALAIAEAVGRALADEQGRMRQTKIDYTPSRRSKLRAVRDAQPELPTDLPPSIAASAGGGV